MKRMNWDEISRRKVSNFENCFVGISITSELCGDLMVLEMPVTKKNAHMS